MFDVVNTAREDDGEAERLAAAVQAEADMAKRAERGGGSALGMRPRSAVASGGGGGQPQPTAPGQPSPVMPTRTGSSLGHNRTGSALGQRSPSRSGSASGRRSSLAGGGAGSGSGNVVNNNESKETKIGPGGAGMPHSRRPSDGGVFVPRYVATARAGIITPGHTTPPRSSAGTASVTSSNSSVDGAAQHDHDDDEPVGPPYCAVFNPNIGQRGARFLSLSLAFSCRYSCRCVVVGCIHIQVGFLPIGRKIQCQSFVSFAALATNKCSPLTCCCLFGLFQCKSISRSWLNV